MIFLVLFDQFWLEIGLKVNYVQLA